MKKLNKNTPAEPVRTVSYALYKGDELKPFEGRVGAMDAYKLPSIRGGRAVEPSLYMREETPHAE